MTEECNNCKYWNSRGNGIPGMCQKHAPVFEAEGKQDDISIRRKRSWPETSSYEWCGEWEDRRQKE